MKVFQIIHLEQDDDQLKQGVLDTLLVHNLPCFGLGPHLVILDEKKKDSRDIINPEKVLKLKDVQTAFKKAGAQLLHFDKKAFAAFKKYLSKEYVFQKESTGQMSYKSKTQPAEFTIYDDGHLKTSKDLLDIALIQNLVRIMYGEKPQNPKMSL